MDYSVVVTVTCVAILFTERFIRKRIIASKDIDGKSRKSVAIGVVYSRARVSPVPAVIWKV